MRSVPTIAAVLALGLAVSVVVAQSPVQTTPATDAVHQLTGIFPEGTRWRIQAPPNWNGTLFLDLDGAGFVGPAGGAPMAGPARAFDDWLLSQGYALGGTTREPVGYDFPRAVDNLLKVRQLFTEKWGPPKRTLMKGMSRGAFAVRMALELRPDVFDGGVMSAGGGAGEIAVLNNKLNALFVLKTLVDPAAPLKLVDIDPQAEQAALNALLARANASPQGRARLALAAAVEQYARWTSRSKRRPAPTDYDGVVDQIVESFGFGAAVPVRAGVEKVAGGNVSWNTGVDYGALLRRSGRRAMVEALYRKAGLSLQDDLATLAAAPRIQANPAAVRRAEPLMTYTGRIADPLVNLDNDDPVDPASDKLAYVQTLKKAGTAGNFRLIWADVPGHAGMSDLDRAVSVQLLVNRLDTGRWGDTSLPALKKLADQIAGGTSLKLGQSALFEPGRLPEPSNVWDVSNWATYRANAATDSPDNLEPGRQGETLPGEAKVLDRPYSRGVRLIGNWPRIVDIRNPANPVEVAYFKPGDSRSGSPASRAASM